jgi:hypothetical protein
MHQPILEEEGVVAEPKTVVVLEVVGVATAAQASSSSK